MITRVIDGNIQPGVPTYKPYLMNFQCLHYIPNFFRPRVVCWRQEWYSSGIAQPQGETKKLVAKEILRGLSPLRHPLGLLIRHRLEKGGTSGGKIEICFPPRLRNDRLQDRQDDDRC